MIKKSIFVAFILFALWTAFLVLKPNASVSQHVWQENVITAEQYLYDVDYIPNVIVGSSLSERIITDSLPEFFSLAFGGQSIYDGLEILAQKKKLPKRVFIEINLVQKFENTTFKEIISSPIMNQLKANVVTFRSDKQPLAFIGNYLSAFVGKVHGKIVPPKTEESDDESKATSPLGEDFFKTMLDIRKKNYSITVKKTVLDKQIAKLKTYINYLRSKNVEIVFFEMPVHPDIINFERAVQIRNKMNNEFKGDHYQFISLPENLEDYHTSDGTHLNDEDAVIFTQYLKSQIQRISE
jgi:hypothetical protein